MGSILLDLSLVSLSCWSYCLWASWPLTWLVPEPDWTSFSKGYCSSVCLSVYGTFIVHCKFITEPTYYNGPYQRCHGGGCGFRGRETSQTQSMQTATWVKPFTTRPRLKTRWWTPWCWRIPRTCPRPWRSECAGLISLSKISFHGLKIDIMTVRRSKLSILSLPEFLTNIIITLGN